MLGTPPFSRGQFANGLALGVETEFNANDGSDRNDVREYGVVDPERGWQGETNLKWSGSARIRMGYAMDRWLPYVTAGVAYAGYDFATHYSGSAWDRGHGTLLGWTVGGGAEYALTDNWRVRASYLYTDYGTDTFGSSRPGFAPPVDPGFAPPVDSYDIELATHALTAGISFNWEHLADMKPARLSRRAFSFRQTKIPA